jgi:hypothetical protein
MAAGQTGAGVNAREGIYGRTLNNRYASRARQRAYRDLAERHAEEFAALLTQRRQQVEDDDDVADPFGRGRPRKASA